MLALSINNIPAVIEARITLELGLVTIAAEKITDEQLNRLKGTIDSLLMAHEKTDSLIPFREPEITIEYHTAIYEALKKRDPIQSFEEMYKHLSYVREKILSRNDV